jgi:ribosomal protein S18 acetylase RimI-like enzyme
MTAIRPARIEELPGLIDLVKAAVRHMESQGIYQWDDNYPNTAILQADIEKRHLHVIEVNGQIAGMISINEEQSPEYQTVPWQYAGKALVIHRLTITPAFQRQKLATNLMDFAEKAAENQRYDTIRLDVFTENPSAIKLYKHLGYEEAGTVRFRKGLFFCFEKPVGKSGKK